MSTFPGPIPEFPGVCVDQFEKDNWDYKIFFLSHVHSDHMRGLKSTEFQSRLRYSKIIYASEVSVLILRKKFPFIASQFAFLPLNEGTHLKTTDNQDFIVTLLPAAHCPGSVMFLFEKDDVSVLYTGDFRLNVADVRRFKGLYDSQRKLKRIDKIYLDTTFMQTKYQYFPSREESLNEICRLISEWIVLSEDHVVNLQTAYFYGSEYIINEVSKRFRIPVHVDNQSYESYVHFPNMDGCVTLDAPTSIHLHCGGYQAICMNSNYERKILITAMAWANQRKEHEISLRISDHFYRVCYSSHSSLSEIHDILEFLQPGCIEANVLPKDGDNRNLQQLLDEYNFRENPKPSKIKKIDNAHTENEQGHHIFMQLKEQRTTDKATSHDEDLDFSIFD